LRPTYSDRRIDEKLIITPFFSRALRQGSCLAAEKRAAEVDIDHLVPSLERVSTRASCGGTPRAVYEDIDCCPGASITVFIMELNLFRISHVHGDSPPNACQVSDLIGSSFAPS